MNHDQLLGTIARAERRARLKQDELRMEKRLAIYRHHLEEVVDQQQENYSELQLHHQLILNTISEGIIGVDMAGLISFANKAASFISGHQELVGMDYHDLHLGSGSCEFCEVLQGETPASHPRTVWQRPDSSPYPVRLGYVPSYKEGRRIGGIIVFRDLTSELAQEETIRSTQIELATKRLLTELNLAPAVAGQIGEVLAECFMPPRRYDSVAGPVEILPDVERQQKKSSGALHAEYDSDP